jgi:hypothetical protein
MRPAGVQSHETAAPGETAARVASRASDGEEWLGNGASDNAMTWATPKAPKGDRGYGYTYQKLRKQLLPQACGTPCVRCGELMLPGQKLHLDHDDWDRSIIRGFAHSDCNIRAAAKKARAIQTAAKRRSNRPVHRW